MELQRLRSVPPGFTVPGGEFQVHLRYSDRFVRDGQLGNTTHKRDDQSRPSQ